MFQDYIFYHLILIEEIFLYYKKRFEALYLFKRNIEIIYCYKALYNIEIKIEDLYSSNKGINLLIYTYKIIYNVKKYLRKLHLSNKDTERFNILL